MNLLEQTRHFYHKISTDYKHRQNINSGQILKDKDEYIDYKTIFKNSLEKRETRDGFVLDLLSKPEQKETCFKITSDIAQINETFCKIANDIEALVERLDKYLRISDREYLEKEKLLKKINLFENNASNLIENPTLIKAELKKQELEKLRSNLENSREEYTKMHVFYSRFHQEPSQLNHYDPNIADEMSGYPTCVSFDENKKDKLNINDLKNFMPSLEIMIDDLNLLLDRVSVYAKAIKDEYFDNQKIQDSNLNKILDLLKKTKNIIQS